MKIIDPRPFDPAMVTTNIALSETLWSAGQYNTGVRRYVLPSYDLYEVVAVPHTNDEPTAGAARVPTDANPTNVPTWAKVGKVNRFSCFDNVLQNPTVFTGGIDMTISASGTSYSTGIAFFNVSGGPIRVTVTDPVDGLIYDKTIIPYEYSNVSNWLDYFTAPIMSMPDAVLLDLPLYASVDVRIRMDGEGQIGEVVLGQVTDLGATTWGSNVSILDFSAKEVDVFGGQNVKERGYANLADFKCHVKTPQVAWIRNTLAARRAKPTVFIGSQKFDATIIFGYYQNFTETLTGPIQSDCVIEIQGLV